MVFAAPTTKWKAKAKAKKRFKIWDGAKAKAEAAISFPKAEAAKAKAEAKIQLMSRIKFSRRRQAEAAKAEAASRGQWGSWPQQLGMAHTHDDVEPPPAGTTHCPKGAACAHDEPPKAKAKAVPKTHASSSSTEFIELGPVSVGPSSRFPDWPGVMHVRQLNWPYREWDILENVQEPTGPPVDSTKPTDRDRSRSPTR